MQNRCPQGSDITLNFMGPQLPVDFGCLQYAGIVRISNEAGVMLLDKRITSLDRVEPADHR